MYKTKITVFTPTYNRGYIIENLYQSLLRQSFRDFEWIVIDDGSTDNTQEVFDRILQDDHFFSITYQKVENGGKHRAINRGAKLTQGELFFIVDSDDYLTDDALETVVKWEKSIPRDQKASFAGVCGCRGYSKQELLGRSFGGTSVDASYLQCRKFGIDGDKAEVYYTHLIQKYPFPEFEGENFVTEAVVWDRIAFDGFKLRYFNEIIYICEYRDDGLTAQGNQLFDKNPAGYGQYLYQCGLFGKTVGVENWNRYLKYYYQFKHRLPFRTISKNLHMNPIRFYFRMLGLKVFYHFYDVK